MISSIWYPLNYFNLSFGKQDRLGKIALELMDKHKMDINSKEDQIESEVYRAFNNPSDKRLQENLNSLMRYVPFRFLRPWFSQELKGVSDSKINSKIIYLANRDFKSKGNLCLYRFCDTSLTEIEISLPWFEYFKTHNKILRDFCLWNLLVYLQKNNPNVPNISEKLFYPQTRNLYRARNFWNLVFSEKNKLTCIYSEVSLTGANYTIDHFIPWRFVTHDLLWNLVKLL